MNKKIVNNKLISILNNVSLKKINKKELKFLNKKKILITGVSGIIGLNLLFFLVNISKYKNLNLKILGNYNSYLFDFVKNYFKKQKNIKFIKLDLTKQKLNLNKKFDLIFHCAGYASPSKFLRNTNSKLSTFNLNSKVIMDLEKNLKINGKFIFLSSTEIYSGNNSLCEEKSSGRTDSTHPRSSYIESKKFAESYIINCMNNYIIFRPCLIYGPGCRLDDGRVLNQVIIRAIKNKKIDVYGGFNQLRSNLYIEDAINMMVKSSCISSNQIFNVNNHKMTSLKKVFIKISKISKKKIINHGSKIKGSPSMIKISNKKILKILNYKISTSLKEGLTKTINWYSNLIQYNKSI